MASGEVGVDEDSGEQADGGVVDGGGQPPSDDGAGEGGEDGLADEPRTESDAVAGRV